MGGDDRSEEAVERATAVRPDGGEPVDYAARAKDHLGFSRWWLIVAAVLAMAVISHHRENPRWSRARAA